MMNVHSQCSRTYYQYKPRCTAPKASGFILHRYGELSAANFHFMLPYCLFHSYYQVQCQQWNRNRLFEPVANFTEGDRFEWTATEWFVRNKPNTRTLMPRVPQVATLLVNPGFGSEKPPKSKLILFCYFIRSCTQPPRSKYLMKIYCIDFSHPWPFP